MSTFFKFLKYLPTIISGLVSIAETVKETKQLLKAEEEEVETKLKENAETNL